MMAVGIHVGSAQEARMSASAANASVSLTVFRNNAAPMAVEGLVDRDSVTNALQASAFYPVGKIPRQVCGGRIHPRMKE